jgi:hypothetical protein
MPVEIKKQIKMKWNGIELEKIKVLAAQVVEFPDLIILFYLYILVMNQFCYFNYAIIMDQKVLPKNSIFGSYDIPIHP